MYDRTKVECEGAGTGSKDGNGKRAKVKHLGLHTMQEKNLFANVANANRTFMRMCGISFVISG